MSQKISIILWVIFGSRKNYIAFTLQSKQRVRILNFDNTTTTTTSDHTSATTHAQLQVLFDNVFSESDNLIPDSAGGEGQAQRAQLQPFSFRFKTIIS